MTTMTAEPITSLTWRRYGLCKPYNADLFDGFTEDDRREASHLCLHRCPVLSWCDAWRLTQNKTELLGVVAGVSYGK